MKLISCHIENFGKLSDFTYHFTEGCNIICKENGWGKSTLAAFIRVMLFGFSGEGKRGVYDNERKRFAPWQKGVYGGELQFEAGGKGYLIRRVFGAKAAEDEFSIIDTDTLLPCRDFSARVGEELFQIDSDSFERTVFISQNDCETKTTDSINAKIGNLAENTDDINNYETAGKKINDLLNAMSPSRKTGSLNKIKSSITGLQTQIRNSAGVEDAISLVLERKKRCMEEREQLLKSRQELLEKQKVLGQYKDLQAKRNKYLDLQEEYKKRLREFQEAERQFPGRLPDEKGLEAADALCSRRKQLQNAVEIYRLTDRELEELEAFSARYGDKAPHEEELAQMEALAQRHQFLKLAAVREELSAQERERLEECENRFGTGREPEELQEELSRMQSLWREGQEKKSMLPTKEMALETLKRNHRQAARGKILGAFLLTAGGLMLLGAWLSKGAAQAALAFFVLGGLLAAGGIFAEAAFLMRGLGKKESGKKGADSRKAVCMNQEALRRLCREIELDREQIEEALKSGAAFCEAYGMEFEEGLFSEELARLQSQLADYAILLQKKEMAAESHILSEKERLENRLLAFTGRFLPRDNAEEEGFTLALSTIRQESRTLLQLQEKYRAFQESRAGFLQLSQRLEEYFASLNLAMKENPEAQLAGLRTRLQSYASKKAELQRAETEKHRFEETEDTERLLALSEQKSALSLEALSEKLREDDKRFEALGEAAQGYENQLVQLQEEWEELQDKKEELDGLLKRQHREEYSYRMLSETKRLLEQAKNSFTARYTEPVMSAFRKYYSILSRREGSAFYMEADTRLRVMEQSMPRETIFLSCGNRDLIGICMRMALVDVMYVKEKPFLIMDDPFVNLDAEKTEGSMEFLKIISEGCQIIYFTCHESRGKEILQKPKIS